MSARKFRFNEATGACEDFSQFGKLIQDKGITKSKTNFVALQVADSTLIVMKLSKNVKPIASPQKQRHH